MLWKRRGVPPLLQDRIPRDPEDFVGRYFPSGPRRDAARRLWRLSNDSGINLSGSTWMMYLASDCRPFGPTRCPELFVALRGEPFVEPLARCPTAHLPRLRRRYLQVSEPPAAPRRVLWKAAPWAVPPPTSSDSRAPTIQAPASPWPESPVSASRPPGRAAGSIRPRHLDGVVIDVEGAVAPARVTCLAPGLMTVISALRCGMGNRGFGRYESLTSSFGTV